MPTLLRLAPALLLLLAACGSNDNDPGPGGVSVGEAKALDEAAEMLEKQRINPEDVPQPAKSATAQPPS